MNAIRIALVALTVGALTGCVSRTHRGSLQQADAVGGGSRLVWPDDYRPEDATFFVYNSIQIDAAPETVWADLIDAVHWPEWYPGAENVTVQSVGTEGTLGPDAVLKWRTMGLDFESQIRVFEPPFRLAWESRRSSIRGYHTWLIVPRPDGGCDVITAEAQHGFLAVMQGLFIPNKLHRLHDDWLARLKQRAEVGARSRGVRP